MQIKVSDLKRMINESVRTALNEEDDQVYSDKNFERASGRAMRTPFASFSARDNMFTNGCIEFAESHPPRDYTFDNLLDYLNNEIVASGKGFLEPITEEALKDRITKAFLTLIGMYR